MKPEKCQVIYAGFGCFIFPFQGKPNKMGVFRYRLFSEAILANPFPSETEQNRRF
jgi:hypothetical protein